MTLPINSEYKWFVKLSRVSLPWKLKKTSYLNWGEWWWWRSSACRTGGSRTGNSLTKLLTEKLQRISGNNAKRDLWELYFLDHGLVIRYEDEIVFIKKLRLPYIRELINYFIYIFYIPNTIKYLYFIYC